MNIGNDEEWVGTVDVNITFETENRSEVKKQVNYEIDRLARLFRCD